MKKKLLACSLLVIGLSTAAYGTVAYFTHEDTATNVITAGDIQIALQEWTVPEEGGEPVPFEDVIDVLPGAEVSKIVEVKNIGGQTAYIRVAVDKEIRLAAGVEGTPDTGLIACDLNTEYWTEKDGWYYYNAPLNAGDTTEPLFTTVTFEKNMSNLYQNSSAVIRVTAQATQTAHNGDTAIEAAGWPDAASCSTICPSRSTELRMKATP